MKKGYGEWAWDEPDPAEAATEIGVEGEWHNDPDISAAIVAVALILVVVGWAML